MYTLKTTIFHQQSYKQFDYLCRDFENEKYGERFYPMYDE